MFNKIADCSGWYDSCSDAIEAVRKVLDGYYIEPDCGTPNEYFVYDDKGVVVFRLRINIVWGSRGICALCQLC